MKILALDPAARTGWAWQDTATPNSIAFGTWNLGTSRALSEQHQELERLLEKWIRDYGVDTIASENAGFGSHNPAVQASHNERLGLIRLITARHSCELILLNPMTIKVFATGNGHAKKDQMIATCKSLLQITPGDDNQADAIWLLKCALRPDCWPQPAAKKPPAKAFRSPKAAKKAGRLF